MSRIACSSRVPRDRSATPSRVISSSVTNSSEQPSLLEGISLLALLLLAAVALMVAAPLANAQAGPGDGCLNAGLRVKQGSSHLPDCRAYEQVSPVGKEYLDGFTSASYSSIGQAGTAFPARDGEAIGYTNASSTADGGSALFALSTTTSQRTDAGWEPAPVRQPWCGNAAGLVASPPVGAAADTYVDASVEHAMFIQPEAGDDLCGQPLLDSSAPTPWGNLYLATFGSAGREYSLLAPMGAALGGASGGAAQITRATADYGAASDDASAVAYGSSGTQTSDSVNPSPPNTPAALNFRILFKWQDGSIQLISKDTSGAQLLTTSAVAGGITTAIGGGTASSTSDARNAMSANGDNVYFQNPATGVTQLYLNDDGTSYDASQTECTSSCGSTAAKTFQWASTDGTKAFFTSTEKLTDTDTNAAGVDLFLYRHSANPATDSNLTFVSKDNEPADGTNAGVLGVLGTADSGDTMYFAASGQLVAGKPTAAGPKVYRWQWNGGSPMIDYIATLASGDTADWNALERRVAPSGDTLMLESSAKLDPVADTDTDTDVYRWTAADGIQCVSCQAPGNPSGGPSTTGNTGTAAQTQANRRVTRELGTAFTEDGDRIYFVTPDKLVSGDRNGPCAFDATLKYYPCADVYQWEDGQLSLISAGDKRTETGLLGISGDGDDVFIFTRQSLVGWDEDPLIDIYDARVEGGFPEPVSETECSGESCQAPPTLPPGASVTGSASLNGLGNVDEVVRSTISGIRKLSSSDRSTLAKGGKARLRLKVNRSGTVTVAGTAKVGKKNRRVVSSSAKAKKAGSVSVRFALSKSALSELGSKGSLTVALTVRFKDARPKVVLFTLKSATAKKGGRS